MEEIIARVFDPSYTAQFLLLGGLAFLAMCIFSALDLITGVRRAKKLGEYRSSRKLRRTLEKLNTYGVFFTLCYMADTLIVVALHLFNTHIPVLPYITFVEVLYICYVEYKSIIENTTNPHDKDVLEKADDVLIKIIKEMGPDKIKEVLTKISDNE